MQSVFAFIQRFFLPLLIGGAVVLLVGAFFLGRYMVYQAHPELSGQEKAATVLAKVGKLIELPKEVPQMATIDDANSVKASQPFLANAQNGDILIVYSASGTAVLYRHSTNKLIAVGPVTNDVPTPTVSAPTPKIEPETHATSTDATTTKTKK